MKSVVADKVKDGWIVRIEESRRMDIFELKRFIRKESMKVVHKTDTKIIAQEKF